jgi:hypothetical protein
MGRFPRRTRDAVDDLDVSVPLTARQRRRPRRAGRRLAVDCLRGGLRGVRPRSRAMGSRRGHRARAGPPERRVARLATASQAPGVEALPPGRVDAFHQTIMRSRSHRGGWSRPLGWRRSSTPDLSGCSMHIGVETAVSARRCGGVACERRPTRACRRSGPPDPGLTHAGTGRVSGPARPVGDYWDNPSRCLAAAYFSTRRSRMSSSSAASRAGSVLSAMSAALTSSARGFARTRL